MKSFEVGKLNSYQKKAQDQIKKILDEDKGSTVITIDTPSGTGKTTLLCSLASKLNHDSVKFLTFRRDQASEIKKMGIDAYTYVSFTMHHFNLNYRDALKMFRSLNDSNITELYNLLIYSKKFVQETTKVIILDMYTIPSPRILLLLFIVSLKHDLCLIFAGNGMQLGAIGKSTLHDGSNFHVIQMFTDLMINKLDKNMRTREKELENKVASFRKILRQCKSAGDVSLNFSLRYALYTICREKYFAQERFDTIYIAQTHRLLTSRILRFIEYLESNKIPYVKAPYYYYGRNGPMQPVPMARKINEKKFLQYLLLVERFRYIYISEKGEHHVVLLENILFNEAGFPNSLIIRFVDNDVRLEITPCKLNYYQVLPAYREWLLKDLVSTQDVWQFPLRPYTVLTYHATLGRTIEKEQVELDTECMFANSLYTGLSSVSYYDNIHKIHDERYLLSHVVTEYMQNERDDYKYYYRCPHSDVNNNLILQSVNVEGRNTYIDGIEWKDVDSERDFECKAPTYYMRIEREVYEKSKVEEIDTPLMQIARFAKERSDIVVNTIKAAPVNGFIEKKKNSNNNNNKKKKQQKPIDESGEPECRAYVQLKKAFEEWIEKEIGAREE